MAKFVKIVIIMLATMVTQFALAANTAKGIYPDTEAGLAQCLADLEAGSAVGYVPTTDHPLTSKRFEQKRVGKGGACLSGAYVREDNKSRVYLGTVAVSEGFEYGVDSGGAYRMVACSNPFKEIHFPAKKVADDAPRTRLKKAKVWDKNPEPAPVVETTARTTVIQTVDSFNTYNINVSGVQRAAEAPAAPAPVAAQSCEASGTCQMGFVSDHEVPRTDGRCVIAFRNENREIRFVRFETMKGSNILHGAKVDNVRADWNKSYELVPMGRTIEGVDRATRIRNVSQLSKPCYTVLAEIKVPGVLDRTWKRLGLTERCRPVGVVGNPQQGSYVRTGIGRSDSASNLVAP